MNEATVSAKLVNRISEIPAVEWDACAGDQNPFVSHAFLDACEASGCCAPERGWGPTHVVLQDAQETTLACAPLYLKSHSRGEFIFDYGWADAFERAGGRYYPKLLSAAPFSPVPGPRLLVPDVPDAANRQRLLIAGLVSTARHYSASSLHINFCLEEEWLNLADAGFLRRNDQQFHWFNDGYSDFDDFLNQLASRKRKAIRKERKGAVANGVEIEVLCGQDITEDHWDAFYHFYTDTGNRKWGTPYFNRLFFSLLGEGMAEQIALIMCKHGGRYIAGALNVIGADTLYGRYWGCIEDHRFLHFEVCYYQAIEFAIRRGLKKVEAGAQGPHKIARGYQPVHIYSAHWIENDSFRDAVEDYLERERREVDQGIDYLADMGPFRKGEQQKLYQPFKSKS